MPNFDIPPSVDHYAECCKSYLKNGGDIENCPKVCGLPGKENILQALLNTAKSAVDKIVIKVKSKND